MSEVLDLLEALELRRLYEYWDEKRGQRAFPARADLDPVDFSYALGIVMLLDVLYEPLRFRFRLHGTRLALRDGYEMTGKMVDELPLEESRTLLLQRCRQVVQTRRPVATRGDRVIDGQRRHYEALWMPLGANEQTIDMLCGGLRYLDP